MKNCSLTLALHFNFEISILLAETVVIPDSNLFRFLPDQNTSLPMQRPSKCEKQKAAFFPQGFNFCFHNKHYSCSQG